MSSDNIVLIGLPGAGKSTLGVVLAKMLNYRFLDCDLLIQEHFGKTLQALIDERGAEGFVNLENAVLKGIRVERTVISTGGSAVYSEQAMEHLRSLGAVVHLQVSYDEMVKRVGDLGERGVVMRGGADAGLKGLFEERMPLYERYADVTLDVSDALFREAAIELKGILEGRGLLQVEMPEAGGGQAVFRHWRSADLTFNMQRQISFDNLDCNRNLLASEAMRLFGDIANADFADLGFTHASMITQGYYFIITRSSTRMLRAPRDEERVTLRTWPHQVKGMQVTRNFDMLDESGQCIGSNESVYMIIDANAGRPIRIMNFPLMEMYQVDRAVEVPKRQRIKLTDDMVEVARTHPRFSDLDVNGHVHNTRYPDFAYNFLPAPVRNRRWTEFQIEYATEMHLDEEVVIYTNDVQAAIDAGDWVKVVGAQPDGTTNFGCLFRFA